MCKLSVDFPFHVFKFLFSNRGRASSKSSRRLYDQRDFDTELFPAGWDVVYDRLGDGFWNRISNLKKSLRMEDK